MIARVLLNLVTMGLVLTVCDCGSTTSTVGNDASTDGGSQGDSGNPGDSGVPRDSSPPVDSSGRDTGGGGCNPACTLGRTCCGGACVNTSNDPFNCGGCNISCTGATPYCNGTCMAAPCVA